MKQLLLLFFIIIRFSCVGQFDNSVTLKATANFNIPINGLATNEAGIGLGLDASLFSTHKLQALIETSAEWFFGDKLFVVDAATGEPMKSAAVHSIRLGPQFFINKNMAFAVTYGPAWSVVRESAYSMNDGFKYSVTGFMGKRRKMVAKAFVVNIPVIDQNIQYVGLAAGFRI